MGQKGPRFEAWIALLLDILSPTQLLKSVKNLPKMDHLRPIVKKLQARRNYFLKHGNFNGADVPPPVQMLVFGGSVTGVSLSQINIILNEYFSLIYVVLIDHFINLLRSAHEGYSMSIQSSRFNPSTKTFKMFVDI